MDRKTKNVILMCGSTLIKQQQLLIQQVLLNEELFQNITSNVVNTQLHFMMIAEMKTIYRDRRV